jgi:ubiquitin carboxyl-terminal hydrolase 4/11/15
MYDLFAVVNHRGESINSGHYTAVVRNPVDGKWRLFDDTHVVEIDTAQVVTASAYLLFYERRARSAIPSVRLVVASAHIHQSGFRCIVVVSRDSVTTGSIVSRLLSRIASSRRP